MPTFTGTITLGNLATIISIIFGLGLTWGNMNADMKEQRLLREQDLTRIVRIEQVQDTLIAQVNVLNIQTTEINTNLKYIRESIDEIKKNTKHSSLSK